MILFKIKQEEMPDILLDCASWAEEDSQTHTLNKFTRKIWDDTWQTFIFFSQINLNKNKGISLLTKSKIGLVV